MTVFFGCSRVTFASEKDCAEALAFRPVFRYDAASPIDLTGVIELKRLLSRTILVSEDHSFSAELVVLVG